MSYNQQPYNPAYQNPYPNQGPPPPGFNTGDGQNQNQGERFFKNKIKKSAISEVRHKLRIF